MNDELPAVLRDAVALGEPAQVTPARLLLGRTGSSYRTSTQLSLRADHAFARDALHERLSLDSPPLSELAQRHRVIEITSAADDHDEYLARPDLGRRLPQSSVDALRAHGVIGADVQLVIGDGLSPRAVATQVPLLLDPLIEQIAARGWSMGPPIFVRHCRVGIINDIGSALDAQDVVLLIGERPGLATAESLSAYLAHEPRPGDTDADRNLVSNIHRAGVAPLDAVRRVIGLLETFRLQGRSGYTVKEPEVSASLLPPAGR